MASLPYPVYEAMDIIKLMKHCRLPWTGHIFQMPKERQVKIISNRETVTDQRYRGPAKIDSLFGVFYVDSTEKIKAQQVTS